MSYLPLYYVTPEKGKTEITLMQSATDETESNQLTSGQVREVHSFFVSPTIWLQATDEAIRSSWMACARTSVTQAEGKETIGCKSLWAFASLSLENVQGPGMNFEFRFYVRTVVLCKSRIGFTLARNPKTKREKKGAFSEEKENLNTILQVIQPVQSTHFYSTPSG